VVRISLEPICNFICSWYKRIAKYLELSLVMRGQHRFDEGGNRVPPEIGGDIADLETAVFVLLYSMNCYIFIQWLFELVCELKMLSKDRFRVMVRCIVHKKKEVTKGDMEGWIYFYSMLER
jgi:hypothetical protein